MSFDFTVSALPAWPLSPEDGDGDDPVAGEDAPPDCAAAVRDCGTSVASGPSRTSTCPAVTDELAVAVMPVKYPAIVSALWAAPVPYRMCVDDCAFVSATVPALNPAEVSAWDIWPASPPGAPPLYTSTVVFAGDSDADLADPPPFPALDAPDPPDEEDDEDDEDDG